MLQLEITCGWCSWVRVCEIGFGSGAQLTRDLCSAFNYASSSVPHQLPYAMSACADQALSSASLTLPRLPRAQNSCCLLGIVTRPGMFPGLSSRNALGSASSPRGQRIKQLVIQMGVANGSRLEPGYPRVARTTALSQ